MANKVDSNIGSLPKTSYLAGDSLMVAEQQGEAVAVPGDVFINFARESVQEFTDEAAAAAELAHSAIATVESARKDAQAAAKEAAAAISTVETARKDAEAAADKAEGFAADAQELIVGAEAAKEIVIANANAAAASERNAAASEAAAASSAATAAAVSGTATTAKESAEAAAKNAKSSAEQAASSASDAAAAHSGAAVSASGASTSAYNAAASETAASSSAAAAKKSAERIENMEVEARTLIPGAAATVEKVSTTDALTLKFGLPSGRDGENGVSATHRWEGTTLIVSSASGTTAADLKGPPGENGIIAPVNGFFTLSVDADGNLWANSADEGSPLEFEYDTETGDFYIIQEVEE